MTCAKIWVGCLGLSNIKLNWYGLIAIGHVHCITAIHVPVHATCTFSSAGATHLRGVLRYLEKQNLVSRWKRIGLELELTYDNLEYIQSNKDSVEDCATAMLYQWLTSGRAIKQVLLDAVHEVK